MKKLIPVLALLLASICFLACEKEEQEVTPPIYTPQGSVVFYTVEGTCGPIEVSIDGEFVGSFSMFSSNGITPECGDENFLTATVDVGERNFNASCGQYSWSGTVNITTDDCTAMQLNY